MNTTKTSVRLSRLGTTVLYLAIISISSAACADSAKKPAPTNPVWQEECGSCHIAYPPRFLPAESWQRLMGSLEDHFGTDASTDADTAATIRTFLVQNAKRSKTDAKASDAPLRITETRWFVHEHDEISAAKWKSPAIKSAANCGACHREADKGSFRERDIKVP
ncbi:MAG: diheme cytochrome c [Gammaproteobacteria bacterium]